MVTILAERRFLITALVSLLAYVVLYLAAMQYLIFAPGVSESFLSLQIVRDWQDLVLRERAPFLFEPVGALYIGPLALFLSLPNLAIGLALGFLVSANIAVSYYGFRILGMRGTRGLHALIGTIPALIGGAACCVPTLILVIGLQLTATLATVWSLLVPISAVLLLASLWWSLHRIAAERVCDPGSRPLKARQATPGPAAHLPALSAGARNRSFKYDERRCAGAADGPSRADMSQESAARDQMDAGDFRPANDSSYPPIEDYAAIGDGRSVALVSREGSLDWLCLPHFSGPPFFAALLDRRRGGRFALRPTEAFRSKRQYVAGTNVLETSFETKNGRCTVTDCMTLLPSGSRDELRPQAEILRRTSGCEGEVELEIICEPRPDFGRAKGKFQNRGRLGWAFACADQILFLRGEMPLQLSADHTVSGRFRISAGETRCVSLAYTRRDIAVVPTLGSDAVERLEATCAWWRDWTDRCTIDGKYRDSIVRSALVLKLLSYSLSGAVVAAATTSLPETVGGSRNWDYRYCWLRDAALIVQAFVDLGYRLEAEFFIDWLLHATRLTWPRLDVLYDVFGEVRLPEVELDHLEGYKGSRPVRIGNGAHEQLQLDVYGSVIQATYEYVERGGKLDLAEARCLAGFGRQVCKLWREPDDGIWEKRSGRAHHTYSKMMCWVALDRLLRLAREDKVRVPVEQFERERHAIEDTVERRGFNADLNSYVGELDGNTADASLILAARCGYRAPDDPRMQGTCDFIERSLAVDGMVYRYEPATDQLPGKEGAFGIASFWMVEYLARAGRLAEAGERFERLLRRGNDLGLYAEEFDPGTGAALGNFPQAFTHVGLITAAMALRRGAARTSRESP